MSEPKLVLHWNCSECHMHTITVHPIECQVLQAKLTCPHCGIVGSLTWVQEQKIEHPRMQKGSNVFFGGIRP